ncbi:MAG: hypothetical protein NT157_05280 [Candidatus Micrarchaeota archaeon]|nr:hypothetical protein [Candidatus Micrarchaeota archaeon]
MPRWKDSELFVKEYLQRVSAGKEATENPELAKHAARMRAAVEQEGLRGIFLHWAKARMEEKTAAEMGKLAFRPRDPLGSASG